MVFLMVFGTFLLLGKFFPLVLHFSTDFNTFFLLHMYQGTFHENTHSDAFLSLLPKNRALWVKVAKLET